MSWQRSVWLIPLLVTPLVACDSQKQKAESDSPEQKGERSEKSEQQQKADPGAEGDSEQSLVEQFEEATESDDVPSWGYSGENGPENWGRLGPQFAMCELGKNQSPIDVKRVRELSSAPEISVNYGEAPSELMHTGHSLKVKVPEGNSMTVGDASFELLQFHFHTPSEHHVEGEEFPIEAHFVHQNEDGELGVLGVMFEEGESNDQLADMLEEIPENEGDSVSLSDADIDTTGLLPDSKSAYLYGGSLTTPPCSEGVHWHLLTEPMTASSEQIEMMRSAVDEANDRPIQPVNARTVVK